MRSAARRRAVGRLSPAAAPSVAASAVTAVGVAALVALSVAPASAASHGSSSAPAAAAPASHRSSSAAPASAAVPAGSCTITDATLTWGFKESFRSYISGSIARGAWEPFGGVGYATPSFTWAGGTGAFDPASGSGSVSLPGGIRFTGHDGLLDSTVQNATLSIDGGQGRLLLDLSGVTMDSALAGENVVETHEQVPLVSVDLAALSVEQSGQALTLSATDAATAITAEGFEAFGNYETGTAFDPLTFTASGECAAPTPTPTASQTPEALDADNAAADGDAADTGADGVSPALVAVIISSVGAAIAATAAGIVGVRVARRRRAAADGTGDGPSA